MLGIMSTGPKTKQSELGMVLMSTLAILSVLVMVGMGAGVMLQNDYRTLANLRGSTEAFYNAVAGIEWGKSEIARISAFPPVPQNRSMRFAGGEFTVVFQSSAVTGPLKARIVLRATGHSGGAEHVLQTQLTKSYDLADAAVGLRGNGAGVNLSGNPIFISGADHDAVTGTRIATAKSRSAVSTADDALRTMVEQALGTPPREGVLDEVAGVSTILTSDYLPTDVVTQLAENLCASALAASHVIAGNGGLTLENESWGNQNSPQLHCVHGIAASGDAVTIAGNLTGAGILVVRDADLVLGGTFRWEGLVVVTGNDVSLKTTGSGSKEVIGAAIINETGNPGPGRKILDIQGNLRMLFSRQNLNRVGQLIPAPTLNNTYTSLPSVISQDYWRAVTP
jgi:hypothetical protein